MTNEKQQAIDLPMGDLDHVNATIAALALESSANAIAAFNKDQYAPAVRFLRQFAAILFDVAVARAEADGLAKLRSPEEAQTALEKAAKRHLN